MKKKMLNKYENTLLTEFPEDTSWRNKTSAEKLAESIREYKGRKTNMGHCYNQGGDCGEECYCQLAE